MSELNFDLDWSPIAEEEIAPVIMPECTFCYDKKAKKEIPIWFMDKANNLRISFYCPYCGRKFKAVD